MTSEAIDARVAAETVHEMWQHAFSIIKPTAASMHAIESPRLPANAVHARSASEATKASSPKQK